MNRVDIAATALLTAGLIVPALYSASFGGIQSAASPFEMKYECRNMSASPYANFKAAECHLKAR